MGENYFAQLFYPQGYTGQGIPGGGGSWRLEEDRFLSASTSQIIREIGVVSCHQNPSRV